jgi:putative transposase
VSTRSISFSEHEFYHVYNRGTDKRVIYQSPSDYHRFLELLFLSNNDKAFTVRDVHKVKKDVYEYVRGEQLVAIGAFCLMPNHFHLLITPLTEGGVSKFMGKLMTGYSMYFNKKYERTGSLFEGTFKAKHADSDEYLKYLFSYIHLNPVSLTQPGWKENGIEDKQKVLDFISRYEYSSLTDYLRGGRKVETLLGREVFPDYFLTIKNLETELFTWLEFDPEPS